METVYNLPPTPDDESLTEVIRLGPHLMLCRYDPNNRRKRPVRHSWNKQIPTHAQIIAHRDSSTEALYGIVPSSIHQAIADIDQADPTHILNLWLHHLIITTLHPNRLHLWWPSPQPQPPSHFHDISTGVSRGIRGSDSYLIIWTDQHAQSLIKTVHAEPNHNDTFPAKYFDLFRTTPDPSSSHPHQQNGKHFTATQNGLQSGEVRLHQAVQNANEARLMNSDRCTTHQISTFLGISLRTAYRYLSPAYDPLI